jgi:hypothetical protein
MSERLHRPDDPGYPLSSFDGLGRGHRDLFAQEVQVHVRFLGDQCPVAGGEVGADGAGGVGKRLAVAVEQVGDRGEVVGDELQVVGDELDRGVDLVGDAGGELADGFELLSFQA